MGGRGPPEAEFRFGRRRIVAHEGDSVAAALHRAGIRVLSRSIKYHRPRGYFCGTGRCTGCLMTANGEPNVRTCQRRAEPGLRVQGQNAWPSVQHDLFGALDLLFRRGMDYHHLLTRPRLIRPALHAIVRHLSGLGKLPLTPTPVRPARRLKADVAVVGAGPAGLRAAAAAREGGASVLLIEQAEEVGGHLTRLHPGLDCGQGREVLEDLWPDGRAPSGLELLAGATAFGFYPSEGLAVAHRNQLVVVGAARWIFAPGCAEEVVPFPNGDLPGVMQESAARILAVRHGIRPGREALLVGPLERLQRLAPLLESVGTRIVGTLVIEGLSPGALESREPLEHGGLSGFHLVRALGGRTLRAVVCERGQARRRIPCDVAVVCGAPLPQLDLFLQAGAEVLPASAPMRETLRLDRTLQTTVSGLYAAGEVAGCQGIETVLLSGTAAGTAAAASLQPPSREALEGAERAVAAFEQASRRSGGRAK